MLYKDALDLLDIVGAITSFYHGYFGVEAGPMVRLSRELDIVSVHLKPSVFIDMQSGVFKSGPYGPVFGRDNDQPPEPRRLQALFSSAKNDHTSMQALAYISSSPSWADLYRAYEVLGKSRGARESGHDTPTIRNFTYSADVLHRHHRVHRSGTTMSIQKGRSFVWKIILKRAIKQGFRWSHYKEDRLFRRKLR